MFKRLVTGIKSFFSKQPLLLLLVAILSLISATSLHPNLFLMGWDNFSSYLNLPISIGNSLSGPWRDYRGLGVASDSEVVDIFHQLFVLPFSWFVPVQLLDQIYLLFSLWSGTLLMYFLGLKFFDYIFNQSSAKGSIGRYSQLFAFLASFFYLFNLNTLSVFYFPIMPYLTRYMAIPLLHLVAFWLLSVGRWSKRWMIMAMVGVLFASTSYLTATVFITLVASLFIHTLFYGHWRRMVIFFSLLIGLNLFWLLSFSNYAIQKSSIVQSAPSNIEGNESLLNRSPELFGFKNQLIFYPNFFDIRYVDSGTKQSLAFHPMADQVNNGLTGWLLRLFPLLYISGGLVIVFEVIRRLWRRNVTDRWSDGRWLVLLWIPVHTAIFGLLSMKEYGPTGSLYQLLINLVPFFEVVFRFGDTKFHPLMMFSAALAAAFGVIYLLNTIRLRMGSWVYPILRTLILLLIIVSTVSVFRTYLTGSFVGYFMYSQIPAPYVEMAKTINADPDPVRVLHLPFDKYGYWRPYTWGYFGSAFFSFMINKPYIDRTFEPGSIENSVLANKLYAQIEFLPTVEESDQQQAIYQLYQVLQDNNIKYLIEDETINTQVVAQGQTYWGSIPGVQTKMAFDLLKKYGYITERSSYAVNPYDYLRYQPGSDRPLYVSPDISLPQQIVLYELVNPSHRISFADQARLIDPELTNLAETSLYPSTSSAVLMQPNDQVLANLTPFKRTDATIKQDNRVVNYQLNSDRDLAGQYQLLIPAAMENDGRLVKVTAAEINGSLKLDLFEVIAPVINGQQFEQWLGQAEIELSAKQLADLRIRLGENMLDLPHQLGADPQELGVVLIHDGSATLEVLVKNQERELGTELVAPTDPTDCLATKLADYRAYVSGENNQLTMTTRNGSTCVVGDLASVVEADLAYAELYLEANLAGVDLDPLYLKSDKTPTALETSVTSLAKPNSVYVCLEYLGAEPCGNRVRNLSFNGQKTIVLPMVSEIDQIDGLRFVLGLRNLGYQEQRLTVNQMRLVTYQSLQEYQINLGVSQPVKMEIELAQTKTLELELPKTISKNSSYNNSSNYDLSLADAPCEDPQGYRTTRVLGQQFITYTRKCGNGLFLSKQPLGSDMYLWLVDYNLVSGQFPSLRLSDPGNEYLNQRISVNQGYPEIPGFKRGRVEENMTTVIGSYVLANRSEVQDQKNKIFAFSQYSENDGVVVTKSNDIVALPSQWGELVLVPTNQSDKQYQRPNGFSFEQILPALWQVNLKPGDDGKNHLMIFKDGYDQQWVLYDSWWGVLTGFGDKTLPQRCNGLHNCYELAADKTKVYLIYEPLRLSVLGVLGSVMVLSGIGLGIWRMTKRTGA